MTKISIDYQHPNNLRPRPGNPRTHSGKQIRQIAKSIEHFGFTNPVLIDDDNGIVAGHGRVAAAKQLGKVEVPTLRLSGIVLFPVSAHGIN